MGHEVSRAEWRGDWNDWEFLPLPEGPHIGREPFTVLPTRTREWPPEYEVILPSGGPTGAAPGLKNLGAATRKTGASKRQKEMTAWQKAREKKRMAKKSPQTAADWRDMGLREGLAASGRRGRRVVHESERHRLLTWNGGGFSAQSSAISRLPALLADLDVDVAALTETWAYQGEMLAGHSAWTGYDAFGVQPKSAHQGGAILLCRKNLHAKFAAEICMAGGQAVLASVSGGLVGAAYARPGAPVAELVEFIRRLEALPGAVILGGDFNAKSLQWDSSGGNLRGAALAQAKKLEVAAPLGGTFHIRNGRRSCLDLVVSMGPVTVTRRPETAEPHQENAVMAPMTHVPVVAEFEWRASASGSRDRLVRPAVLADEKILSRAESQWDVQLPALEILLDQVKNEAELEQWYQEYVQVMRGPFLAGSKPARAKPSWTRHLDRQRAEVTRLRKSGRNAEAEKLAREIRRARRKSERTRRAKLLALLPETTCPRAAARIRRAVGLAPKRGKSAPVSVRENFGAVVRKSDKPLSAPLLVEKFEVSQKFSEALWVSGKALKAGRAPGVDGVYVEMVHAGGRMHHSLIVELWKKCGRLGFVPSLFASELVEPIHKGLAKGPRDSPTAYRPIGIGTVAKALVEGALQVRYDQQRQSHVAQTAFRKRTSVLHAALRILSSSRLSNGPIGLLDIAGAYPGVDRTKLVHMVRQQVGVAEANMQSLLLQPTEFSVIGDPAGKMFYLRNGITQGKRDATGLWSMYIDPLLHSLDPHQTGMVVTASADDVTLHPGSAQELEAALDKCDDWAWDSYASWCPAKCTILVPPGQKCVVRLSGKQIPVRASGRCLGMQITAGIDAEVVEKIALKRIQLATGLASKWRGQVPVARLTPNWNWRRRIFMQLIQPVAEFGLLVSTITGALEKAMKAFDRAAARFVFGASHYGTLTRAQALFRLEPLAHRRTRLTALLRVGLVEEVAEAAKTPQSLEEQRTVHLRRRMAGLRLADMENCPGAVEKMHPEIAGRETVQEGRKAKLRVLRKVFQAGSQLGTARGVIPPLTLGHAYGDMRLPLPIRGHPFYKLYPGLSDTCMLWYLGAWPILPLVREKVGREWTERLLAGMRRVMSRPPVEDEFDLAYGKRLVFYVEAFKKAMVGTLELVETERQIVAEERELQRRGDWVQ